MKMSFYLGLWFDFKESLHNVRNITHTSRINPPCICGSKAFQVYFDDVNDSSQESRVKTSFKNQRVVQSRIKIQVKSQDSSEESRFK